MEKEGQYWVLGRGVGGWEVSTGCGGGQYWVLGRGGGRSVLDVGEGC